ncbi:MAG: tRNA pseudouridine(55) synthase TruB [Bacteroidetes bacterium]|nr:MAG: tRNA pseudouridine(55) synthase TruB [Bacteroidota bacterium]
MVRSILYCSRTFIDNFCLKVIKKCSDFEEGEVLLLDKPLYWTSFDLVNKVKLAIRHHCGLKKLKVGHAGTLDPLATGLMIVCTGRATKRIDDFRDLDKTYTAVIRFGQTTPSFDLESEVDGEFPANHITEALLMERLTGFLGEQDQEPPLFSAKFVDGKRAYELARKKVEKRLDPVRVFFRELELIDYSGNDATVRIVCSKGTYVRAFARDLGRALGSGAHLRSLVRDAIGEFRLEKALSLEELKFFLENLKQSENSFV